MKVRRWWPAVMLIVLGLSGCTSGGAGTTTDTSTPLTPGGSFVYSAPSSSPASGPTQSGGAPVFSTPPAGPVIGSPRTSTPGASASVTVSSAGSGDPATTTLPVQSTSTQVIPSQSVDTGGSHAPTLVSSSGGADLADQQAAIAAVKAYKAVLDAAYAAPNAKDWTADIKAHEAMPILTDDLEFYQSMRRQMQRQVSPSKWGDFQVVMGVQGKIVVSYCADVGSLLILNADHSTFLAGSGSATRGALIVYRYDGRWMPAEPYKVGPSSCHV